MPPLRTPVADMKDLYQATSLHNVCNEFIKYFQCTGQVQRTAASLEQVSMHILLLLVKHCSAAMQTS